MGPDESRALSHDWHKHRGRQLHGACCDQVKAKAASPGGAKRALSNRRSAQANRDFMLQSCHFWAAQSADTSCQIPLESALQRLGPGPNFDDQGFFPPIIMIMDLSCSSWTRLALSASERTQVPRRKAAFIQRMQWLDVRPDGGK